MCDGWVFNLSFQCITTAPRPRSLNNSHAKRLTLGGSKPCHCPLLLPGRSWTLLNYTGTELKAHCNSPASGRSPLVPPGPSIDCHEKQTQGVNKALFNKAQLLIQRAAPLSTAGAAAAPCVLSHQQQCRIPGTRCTKTPHHHLPSSSHPNPLCCCSLNPILSANKLWNLNLFGSPGAGMCCTGVLEITQERPLRASFEVGLHSHSIIQLNSVKTKVVKSKLTRRNSCS